jgi:hypothetical protein
VLVNELLVVGNQGLGDSLADGIDLRSVTTTGDTDTDVDTGELVKANDKEGFVDLGGFSSVQFCGKDKCTRHICSGESCSAKRDCVWVVTEDFVVRTLNRKISGWTRERGWPFTLMRPEPDCD